MRVCSRASFRTSSRPRSRCGRRPPRTPACAFCSWARWCCCRSSSHTPRMPTGCFAAKWMLRRTITERPRRGHIVAYDEICFVLVLLFVVVLFFWFLLVFFFLFCFVGFCVLFLVFLLVFCLF